MYRECNLACRDVGIFRDIGKADRIEGTAVKSLPLTAIKVHVATRARHRVALPTLRHPTEILALYQHRS